MHLLSSFRSGLELNYSLHHSHVRSIFWDTLWGKIICAWRLPLQSYYSLNMQYSLVAGLVVALGFYKPQDWPPQMGRLRDVSTVREFWGQFWHQNLRRVRSFKSDDGQH